MKTIKIDSYNYNINDDKKKLYTKKTYTQEELEKTRLLRKRFFDFKKVVGKENVKNINTKDLEDIVEYLMYYPENSIHYFYGIGYISTVNRDRDVVNVLYYGKTEDEAFINAIIDYEFDINRDYEFLNRKKLNKEYSKRFLNGRFSKDDYHGPFFFAELSLQDFRKYYGNNIPDYIINYCEEYVSEVLEDNFKYDYESNCLRKRSKMLKK